MKDEKMEPNENTLSHPCRETCSGWKQGYYAGRVDSTRAQSSKPEWPTQSDINAASFDHTTEYGGEAHTRDAFMSGVEWLKKVMGGV